MQIQTRRIQYYMYVQGQYCYYEVENLAPKLSTYKVEEQCARVLAVLQEEILMRMRTLRITVDSGKYMTIYLTTAPKTDPKIFEKMKEKFFEKIYICKESKDSDVYIACYRHKG